MTNTRMIDNWFPVAAVDEACRTPTGSGRIEKAIFTWFASRPIAQARAAALTSLLPDDPALRPLIEAAVRFGDPEVIGNLAERVLAAYSGKAPGSANNVQDEQFSRSGSPSRCTRDWHRFVAGCDSCGSTPSGLPCA